MHLSNGLAAEWVSRWNIQYKHSIQPTGYTDTQYVHWHVINEEVLTICITGLQPHRQSLQAKHRGARGGQPKCTTTQWGLINSQTKPSKPMLRSNMMVDIQNRHSLPFGNRIPSTHPSVGIEGSKHATKIKTIFSIQIHTDKFLSKNMFSSFFFSFFWKDFSS